MRGFALRARESFWFLPAVFGVAAVVMGQGLVSLDRILITHGASQILVLDALSASGGRGILNIIGTSMLTVAGTSFSITISVLATTSSTYGPRLVRNFLADRANQVVLAIFTATFVYVLVVLRSVRESGDSGGGFVPTISIHFAVLLGIVDVAFLVFFIHHIADSVQITTLQKRVQTDLEHAVEFVFPAERAGTTTRSTVVFDATGQIVLDGASGYVDHVDFDQLRAWAIDNDCVVDVVAMPGVHRISGEVLARVDGRPDLDAESATLRRAFTVGAARTPYQDVRFALQQLVEVAVRGLASGTNDPYTAVAALDLAASSLVPLWSQAEAPEGLLDDDGGIRVLVHWPRADELVQDVFEGVTIYGLEHPIVLRAALGLVDRLEAAASEARRGRLHTVRTTLEKRLAA